MNMTLIMDSAMKAGMKDKIITASFLSAGLCSSWSGSRVSVVLLLEEGDIFCCIGDHAPALALVECLQLAEAMVPYLL
jgi:hypothetical protein